MLYLEAKLFKNRSASLAAFMNADLASTHSKSVSAASKCNRCCWAPAMLTFFAQGPILHDALSGRVAEETMLSCERAGTDELHAQLQQSVSTT